MLKQNIMREWIWIEKWAVHINFKRGGWFMLCKINKYIDYYQFYYDNKQPDEIRHNSNVFLSTGVSSIPAMDLYRELLSNEVKLNTEFVDYVPACGSILLRRVIAFYERWMAGICDEDNEYFKNICITCGSTAAMAFIFSYLKKENADKVLLVGLQYFVYEMLSDHNNIPSYLLVSSKDNITIPSIKEIQSAVEEEGFKYIFITLPMNPSGEKYTHEDFVQLLNLCKKNDCILFLDKCQWEEFEEMDTVYDYYCGKDIVDTDTYDNVVILDSFSKKRNIPGLRIGYVAGKKDVVKYIEYLNYITCCHQTTMVIAPIVIDCYYRMIYMEQDEERRKKIQRDIRKIILKEANNNFARYLLKYVTSTRYQEDARNFINEIKRNYSKYKKNYDYACECLNNAGFRYTKRVGGFNFLFQYDNLYGYTEKEFRDYLMREHSIFIFTQEDFCDHTERKSDKFWIRITVADEVEEFQRKFDVFMQKIKDLSMGIELQEGLLKMI